MREFINYLRDINLTYWGSRSLPIVFIFAMIIIFSMEKVHWKKILLFWYTVIVMGCMFTPVGAYFSEKLWSGSIAYYCRLFSVLPIFFVIAYAAVILLENTKKLSRLLLFVVFCVGLSFFGDNFYTASDVSLAQNLEKLPSDVIEICNFVHSDTTDVTIAVPSDISPYIRQYDDSIFMPYGRLKGKSNSISSALDSIELDKKAAKKLVKKVRKKACDYFVVTSSDLNEAAFYELGFEPCYSTYSYYVYDMRGHSRIHKEYNDAGKIIEKQYYNKKNDLSNGKKRGYAVIKYVYNDVGKKIKADYYDKDGNIVKTKDYEN